ncbi:MAG: hypothetical protein A2Z72_05700 [Omnitrophica bacterium RBG_13_46_9]|nr:MAG: hypothetical protein A2Z72_05700 [Omnitrophica bacterium RBG_13_46_9]
MHLMEAVFCITFSFLVSHLFSWYLLKNSDRFRIGKRIYSERVRLHKKGVPRLGGLAIYAAFYATLLFFYVFRKDYFRGYEIKIVGVFLSSTLIMACGLYDDLIKRLNYKTKFTIQILAILIIIAFGYNVNTITNPFDGKIHIGVLGIPVLVTWLLMIMNAINLIDGLDGLACGISIIVCYSFFVIGAYRNTVLFLPILLSLIGAELAFLRFNFYPARLFLGDSGSFFLGFMVGILAIESYTKRTAVISMIVPLLTLFIPLASVVFTFSRRVAYAKNPFKPDKMHMHYRFLRAGISHRDVVLLYYTATIAYVVLGIFCYFMPKKFEVAIIAFAMVTLWILYTWALYFVNLKDKLRKKRIRNAD